MTKASYFEMIEQLGGEPVDSEIPVELDDFPADVQYSFNLYEELFDRIDSFSGTYLGKDWTYIQVLFDMYDIDKPDRIMYMSILRLIDDTRKEFLSKQKSKE